jgi:hypothetical protein
VDIEVTDSAGGGFRLVRHDWRSPDYQRIAAQFSAVLGLEVTVLNSADPVGSGYEGFRVKTVNGRHAEVAAMLACWHLMLVPAGVEYAVPRRYWCFGGRGVLSLALAMGQAAAFDGSDDWAPIGFSRAWGE